MIAILAHLNDDIYHAYKHQDTPVEFIKLFTTAIICSLTLDLLWLGLIAKNLYEKNIGFLLRKSGGSLAPVWASAIIVYIAIALGIIFFVMPKARGSLFEAFLWGAIFGAITYGIYDFTNHAILANWPLNIVIIDIAWGMFLCGTTSLALAYI
jgi:uncharacterized membrane protein